MVCFFFKFQRLFSLMMDLMLQDKTEYTFLVFGTELATNTRQALHFSPLLSLKQINFMFSDKGYMFYINL